MILFEKNNKWYIALRSGSVYDRLEHIGPFPKPPIIVNEVWDRKTKSDIITLDNGNQVKVSWFGDEEIYKESVSEKVTAKLQRDGRNWISRSPRILSNYNRYLLLKSYFHGLKWAFNNIVYIIALFLVIGGASTAFITTGFGYIVLDSIMVLLSSVFATLFFIFAIIRKTELRYGDLE